MIYKCTLKCFTLQEVPLSSNGTFSVFFIMSQQCVLCWLMSLRRFHTAVCSALTLQGWYSGPTQSQLHRGRQICAALRVGLSVKVPPDS